MQLILSDHNCERHAQEIFYALQRLGYDDLIPMTLNIFPIVLDLETLRGVTRLYLA